MNLSEPQFAAATEDRPRAAWLSPRQTAWGIGLLIAAGLAKAAFLGAYRFDDLWVQLHMALDQGALFAPPTLAGAWAALGPGRLWVRLFLSLVWVSGVGLALAYYLGVDAPWNIAFAMAMLVQWFCVQIPLLALKLTLGINVTRYENDRSADKPVDRQFRIRHLLLATAIVAVLLGLGRVMYRPLRLADIVGEPEILVVEAYFVVSSVVLMTPLILARILPRWTLLFSILALAWICLATFVEVPLIDALLSVPHNFHFRLLFLRNMGQVAWILAFTGVLRLGGYRLTTCRAAG